MMRHFRKKLGSQFALLKAYAARYSATPGSIKWLVASEQIYGGYVYKVPRNKVSPHDPRTETELKKGGMKGGDRMLIHGYAAKYSQFLKPFILEHDRLVIVECGILKGSGLAIWCDLFPNSRVIGLDIDLGHTTNNLPFLRSRGAFRKNTPDLYEFDQLVNNQELMGKILGQEKIDVFIDDGLHSRESIITTLRCVLPYLKKRFVYLIEDNDTIHTELRQIFPQFQFENQGQLTIMYN